MDTEELEPSDEAQQDEDSEVCNFRQYVVKFIPLKSSFWINEL